MEVFLLLVSALSLSRGLGLVAVVIMAAVDFLAEAIKCCKCRCVSRSLHCSGLTKVLSTPVSKLYCSCFKRYSSSCFSCPSCFPDSLLVDLVAVFCCSASSRCLLILVLVWSCLSLFFCSCF